MWHCKVMSVLQSTVFACSGTIFNFALFFYVQHRCTAHTFSKRVSKTSKDEENWTALTDFIILWGHCDGLEKVITKVNLERSIGEKNV